MTSNSLGFYDLMNIAEQNSEQNARKAAQVKFPSFKPAGKNKKMDPKTAKLSENIRKFVMKKEEEKAKEEEAARIKKQHLLELRSKDKKATRRVGAMLRMTKSANKSVMAEAVHSLSDSLVEQGDTEQPDTDDYGYVSSSADAWHKKMMDKYKTIQKSKPVPRSETHYDLKVPEVQQLKDNRRDQSSSSSYNGSGGSKPSPREQEKKKPPPPPPMTFQEIMALAREKGNNPEKFVPPVPLQNPAAHRNKDNFEFGRPMTAQEKAEYLAEKTMKDKVAKSLKDGTFRLNPAKDYNNNKRPTTKEAPKPASFKIPTKSSQSQKDSSSPPLKTSLNTSQKSSPAGASAHKDSGNRPGTGTMAKEKSHLPAVEKTKVTSNQRVISPNSAQQHNGIKSSRQLSEPSTSGQSRLKSEPGFKKPSVPASSSRSVSTPEFRDSRNSSHARPNATIKKPDPMPQGQRSRTSPPPTKKPKISGSPASSQHQNENKARRPPPSDLARDAGPRYLPPTRAPPPPTKPKPAAPKGRQVIESDEEDEYDSEMDDFIDDSDVDPNQISAMIRAITGYDKRKYDYEPDDEVMETSAYDQMREEAKSLRIGIQEDLEDIRMEEEENRRKREREKLKRKQRR